VAPATYEIRIKGSLGQPMVAAFGDFTASIRSPETILSGAIPDQRALHVLLERIGSLGLELLEVRQLRRGEEIQEGEDRAPPSKDRLVKQL
jgi:hypothetical protein